ncbi:MAG TPA: helix-turn-helix transcriptional regulator [Puia sp.]|nr:helix-turn-helix transcriptional regulator [Puia sp.]
MQLIKTYGLKEFIKNHSVIIWIGLLTGTTIILFQAISLLVIYRYLKLDYYLCLVAVFFLTSGILLNSRYRKQVAPVLAQGSLLDLLSNKETIVLQMVAEGKTNKEIAIALFIELSTVKTHVNHIYSKISVSNRKEARKKYSELTEKRLVL